MKFEAAIVLAMIATLITSVAPAHAHGARHGKRADVVVVARTAAMPPTTASWTCSRNSYRSVGCSDAR